MILTRINRLRARWKKSEPLIMRDNPAYANFEIGEWSYGRPQILHFDRSTRLQVGRYCSIADGVRILLGGEHRTDWVTTYPFPTILPDKFRADRDHRSKGHVVIGHDVWVCACSIILSGVTIGNGAVVGAGSVVSQNVPPYAIAVGNPARVLRYRFDADTIAGLQALAWWDWPMDRIERYAPVLLSGRVDELLAQCAGTEASK